MLSFLSLLGTESALAAPAPDALSQEEPSGAAREKTPRDFALDRISAAIMTENAAFPFTRLAPIHPGVEVGVRYWKTHTGFLRHEGSVYLGGYHHRRVENALYLRAEYTPSVDIERAVTFLLPLGIGYQHEFYPGTVYVQDPGTGEWEKAAQSGKPHFLIDLGLGVTWLTRTRVQPFIRYETMGVIPLYSGFTTIRSLLKLGAHFDLDGG